MRVKNNCLKLLLSGVGAFLLECTLDAEIIVLSTPSSSFGEMSLGISYPRVWRDDAKSPNYVAKVALPAVDYTGPYSGRADASNYSVSGSISCTDNPSQRGSSSAGDTVNLYADVVPSSNIRVKFKSNLSVNWVGTNLNTGAGFSFSAIGTEDKGSAISRQPTSVSPLSENKSWTVAVKAATISDYSFGGKPYYKLGTFTVTGGAEIFNPYTNAAYNSKITNMQANYIGNVLSIDTDGGNNQTWVTGKQFPKPLRVKVINAETGAPVTAWINFRIVWPLAPGDYVPNAYPGISLGNTPSFYNGGFTGTNGMVAATLINGSMPYGSTSKIYYVKATCDSCVAGQNEVTFTETAVTPESVTELSIVQCEKYAPVNMEVRNAFIVRAFDTLTHEGESGWTVNFSAPIFPSGATGQKALPGTAPTNGLGISFSTVWTGDKAGEYIYTAKCPSCLKNTQVSCTMRSAALQKLVAEPSDDGPESGDPAVTPMLRISDIVYPDANDNVSFTTYSGENEIGLKADLQPSAAAPAASIAWKVEDSPADSIDSGNPVDPANGQATNFNITAPPVDIGRPLPLKYMIQASVQTPKGIVKSYPRHIKQDVIDKCRQEYMDYVTPKGNKLDVTAVPRSRFSPGVNSEFVQNPMDCYAYIYPGTRAPELFGLRGFYNGIFGIEVNSGYRSPRKNFNTPGASETSGHMYGNAIDISPKPSNSINKNILWQSVASPRMLEKSSGPNIILKYSTSGKVIIIRNPDFNRKYNPKDTNGDGYTDTIQDEDIILQVKDLPWDTLKIYLADSNANGIPNIIENTRWMHLGE